MKPILFYDFETTGLPLWKEPSDAPGQPHVAQVGALLVAPDTRRVISSLDVIVRPDGWTIAEDMAAIHGITTEHALEVGIPEGLAIELLLELALRADFRVAFNESFDARIGRIATKRFLDIGSSDQWKAMTARCAMQMVRPVMKASKTPKLTEAYEFCRGVPLVGAHNALVDSRACMDVFFHVEDNFAAKVVDAEFVPA